MMYHEGLVAVVKSNGKILRENKDEAYLPFGSEYSLLIKNLETRKAMVKVTIDGQDVLDGNSIIIDPRTETEIKGFMTGSVVKNKFKFIKKTEQISDFRGDRIDDGIIRIEYWFEQIVEKRHIVTEHVYHHYEYGPCCHYNCSWCTNWLCPHRVKTWTSNDIYTTQLGSIGSSSETFTSGIAADSNGSIGKGYDNLNAQSVNSFYSSTNTFKNAEVSFSNNVDSFKKKHVLHEQPVQDEGITVKGSETNQQFRYANIGPLEETSKVIILKLIGVKETGQVVEKPVTVKTKKQCPTCGRKSKSHLKYCANCGTFLE